MGLWEKHPKDIEQTSTAERCGPYRTPWIHRDLSRSFHLREGNILAAGATGCIAMNRACEAGETLEAL